MTKNSGMTSNPGGNEPLAQDAHFPFETIPNPARSFRNQSIRLFPIHRPCMPLTNFYVDISLYLPVGKDHFARRFLMESQQNVFTEISPPIRHEEKERCFAEIPPLKFKTGVLGCEGSRKSALWHQPSGSLPKKATIKHR
jgi:hypothetical protein